MQTVLVYGINDDETVADEAPVLLASVRGTGLTPRQLAKFSDAQMLTLFEQLKPESVSGSFVRFSLMFLVDGLPASEENWRIGALPSKFTTRCIQIPTGFMLQQLSVDTACNANPVFSV